MNSFSQRAVLLRGVLTVSAAMLAPLGEAFSRPDANWKATVVAVLLAGAIAARAFLDQSMSMRAETAQEDSFVDEDFEPEIQAPSSAIGSSTGRTISPRTDPLSKTRLICRS